MHPYKHLIIHLVHAMIMYLSESFAVYSFHFVVDNYFDSLNSRFVRSVPWLGMSLRRLNFLA